VRLVWKICLLVLSFLVLSLGLLGACVWLWPAGHTPPGAGLTGPFMRGAIVLAGLLAVLLVPAALLAMRRLMRPVKALSQAAGQMVWGDLDISLPHAGGDEMGRLVDAFAAMAQSVKTRNDAIRAQMAALSLARDELETNVQARTAELTRANEKLNAMQAAAEQVALLSKNLRTLDFDEIVNIISEEVPRLFGARWSMLSLPAGDSDALGIRQINCRCPQGELATREDIAGALASGEICLGELADACGQAGGQEPGVVVPLAIRAGTPEGQAFVQRAYLCMCHIDPRLRQDSRLAAYTAELVQEVLGANLTNARLYRQARRQRDVDLLTGAATRQVLETRLGAEVERCLRYGRPLSLAVLDVDAFGRINAAHGHPIGDGVLKQLADMLKNQTRHADLVGRYGGDEFGIVMTETNLEQAAAAAERIRQAAMAITLPDGSPLTISVGLAQWSTSWAPTPANSYARPTPPSSPPSARGETGRRLPRRLARSEVLRVTKRNTKTTKITKSTKKNFS
jgi:diguanylate cyclase (GGDEF)-like protein